MSDSGGELKAPTRRTRGRPGYDLERLLSVSVDVFTRKGYDGTTMEDLSAQLGISKSAIYHHVSGKGHLLELALSRGLDELEAAAQRSAELEDIAPIDRLERLLRESVHVLMAQQPFVTLLLRVRGNTDVERAALERRRAFDRYVADLVRAAVEDGSVWPGFDPAVAARLLFGMVNSLVEWARPRADDLGADRLADMVCHLASEGLRPAGDASVAGGEEGVPVADVC